MEDRNRRGRFPGLGEWSRIVLATLTAALVIVVLLVLTGSSVRKALGIVLSVVPAGTVSSFSILRIEQGWSHVRVFVIGWILAMTFEAIAFLMLGRGASVRDLGIAVVFSAAIAGIAAWSDLGVPRNRTW